MIRKAEIAKNENIDDSDNIGNGNGEMNDCHQNTEPIEEETYSGILSDNKRSEERIY